MPFMHDDSHCSIRITNFTFRLIWYFSRQSLCCSLIFPWKDTIFRYFGCQVFYFIINAVDWLVGWLVLLLKLSEYCISITVQHICHYSYYYHKRSSMLYNEGWLEFFLWKMKHAPFRNQHKYSNIAHIYVWRKVPHFKIIYRTFPCCNFFACLVLQFLTIR